MGDLGIVQFAYAKMVVVGGLSKCYLPSVKVTNMSYQTVAGSMTRFDLTFKCNSGKEEKCRIAVIINPGPLENLKDPGPNYAVCTGRTSNVIPGAHWGTLYRALEIQTGTYWKMKKKYG